MIAVSEELIIFHSFLSTFTEIHLIVYSFIQQILAELPILGPGVTAVNRTDRPCLRGVTFQEERWIMNKSNVFFTSDSGKKSITV